MDGGTFGGFGAAVAISIVEAGWADVPRGVSKGFRVAAPAGETGFAGLLNERDCDGMPFGLLIGLRCGPPPRELLLPLLLPAPRCSPESLA